jgi:hypothetical protein
MDLSDGASLIFDWFQNHDTYSSKNSYKQLNWKILGEEKLDEDECQAAIELALQELLEQGIAKKIDRGTGKNKDSLYIITESMKNAPITLQISNQTAEQIATVSNSVLPFFTLEKVEPITAKDINEENLLMLIETIVLMKTQIEKNFAEIEELKNTIKNNKKPPE